MLGLNLLGPTLSFVLLQCIPTYLKQEKTTNVLKGLGSLLVILGKWHESA